MMNVPGGGNALTLPSAPADKSQVGYIAIGATAAAPLTVNRGGADTIGTAGATNATVPLSGEMAALQYDAANTRWLAVTNVKSLASLDARFAALGAGAGVFGDGSDGTVTLDGTTTVLGMVPSSSVYTLTRDLFLAAATINSGVVINTNAEKIFCAGALTNNGTIRHNGISAAGAAGQAGPNSNGTGSITAGATGQQGGNGSNASTGTAGTGAVFSVGGGNGGAGGNGPANTGGAGGAMTAIPAGVTPYRSIVQAAIGFALQSNTSFPNSPRGGGGGGGGAGDASSQGGGGGGGGGIVIILAKTLAGTGAIQARGGNGGLGGGTNAGGGGGGGGGNVTVVSSSVSGGAIPGQTIDANGGTGGTKSGTGAQTNGSNGSAGSVILIPN
jgi:hypothetical protein